MADYIVGTASTEAANKLDQLQVLANQAQTRIFSLSAIDSIHWSHAS